MKLIFDVQYNLECASIAAVGFEDWTDSRPKNVYSTIKMGVSEYKSGQFYLRELPCILELIKIIDVPIELIIIDGYVFVSNDQSPGLGYFLYKSLESLVPVIGVAKNQFKEMNDCETVLRGKSIKPLYITSIGIKRKLSADNIKIMDGNYRIPTLLKLTDSEARKNLKKVVNKT